MKSILLVLLCLACWCNGARVLVLGPFGSYSHKLVYMPIAESLAEKGHNVTVVSPFRPKKIVENIREIALVREDDVNFFDFRMLQGLPAVIPRFWFMKQLMAEIYSDFIHNEQFKAIQGEQFDVILIDAIFNEFCLPIADLWQVPIVLISPSIGPPWILGNMGVAHHSASYPSTWTSYSTEMSFTQRLFNTLEVTLAEVAMDLMVNRPLNAMIKRDFPQARTIREVTNDLSLCIVTSNPALNWPRPLPPTIIEVVGLHIKTPKPLPADLKKFADEAGETGFILFTLGSIVKSSTIPKETVQSFVRAFSKIRQRVIWKWEADQPPANLPANVMTVKWLPQGDLLAHGNIRLFISHGGLLGLQEAIFNSVPLLGLPVVNDQVLNVVKIVKEGAGLSLEWETITEDNVLAALDSLLTNASYRGNMSRLSSLMKDVPMDGREKAVYWIEHVLRHGGTRHMRISSLDLPFYQHYLLDVIGLMIFIALLMTALVVFIARRLCNRTRPAKISSKAKVQ